MVVNIHNITHELISRFFEVHQYLAKLIFSVRKLCTGVYGFCTWII